MLDKENYYAPDSISPSPKPGMTRFFSKQVASDKDNASPPLSQRTPIVMQTIGCTPHSTQSKSSAVSQCLRNSSSRFNSRLTENHSVCVHSFSFSIFHFQFQFFYNLLSYSCFYIFLGFS